MVNDGVLEFIRPGMELKQQALAFRDAFYQNGERVINGSGGLDFYETYEEWIGYLERIRTGEEEGFVPSDIWFARRISDQKLVGVIDVRPTLPESKRHFGHVGYAVLPLERKKGYASRMLNWATGELRGQGVKEPVACCHESNAASRSVLEKNGFVLTGSYIEEGTDNKVVTYINTKA